MTRGDVLQDAIAYALIRAPKIVRGLRQGLREGSATLWPNNVVAQLRERGEVDYKFSSRCKLINFERAAKLPHSRRQYPRWRPGSATKTNTGHPSKAAHWAFRKNLNSAAA